MLLMRVLKIFELLLTNGGTSYPSGRSAVLMNSAIPSFVLIPLYWNIF